LKKEKQRIEYFASQIVDASYRIHKETGPGLIFQEKIELKGC
jgi:hypothetical protein